MTDAPDMVNGTFELLAALFLAVNVVKLYHDREVRGVSWISVFFFTTWGAWNLFYYPHLGQWISYLGGVAVLAVNLTWLSMLFMLTRNTELRK